MEELEEFLLNWKAFSLLYNDEHNDVLLYYWRQVCLSSFMNKNIGDNWKLQDWKLQDWKLTDWKLTDWNLKDWNLKDWKLKDLNLKDWKGLQIDRLDNRKVLNHQF